MSSIAVIVPVKGSDPKSRLGVLLNQPIRKQLVVSMLEDVLGAIAKAKLVRDTLVVSTDAEILKFAERYGAKSINEDQERGVNGAADIAMREARDYSACMILPADLPFIRARDIRNAITLYRLGASVVISPSEAYDGTNMLLIRRGVNLRLHYDDDSFHKHTREALKNAIPLAYYYSETVAFDLDRATDVYRALRMGRRCTTITFLARIMRRRAGLKTQMRADER